ncbi:DUF4932 domain-containing protein [Thermococcus sp. ES12]|uniref:DUF4932 domain-containing protein n=1 Tax=Thermococcus sp. ES12 TaxID=1638246 RepID=UPI001430AF32|nr:DUF4932 domain-containing protein [Thermococcus sp. ES12]NJE75866.1 DUF4932 domain-containing protein [Thermococcus sp. ES12]
MKRLVALIIVFFLASTAIPAGAYSLDSQTTVAIPQNYELLGIVYYLAYGPQDPFVTYRGQYLNDVESWFGRYRNHEVVRMLREYLTGANSISERDYRLLYLDQVALSLPPGMQVGVPPSQIKNLAWFLGVDTEWMSEFLTALRDFAEETDFSEFYSLHEAYYQKDIDLYAGALQLLPPKDFMGRYMDLTGIEFKFLHPYLVAFHAHAYRPRGVYGLAGIQPLVRRIPQRTLWSLKTARDTMFGLPLNRDCLNNPGLDRLNYLGMVYHELGHDISTRELNLYDSLPEELSYLESTIEEDMPYLAVYDIHFWGDYGMVYEGFADGWEDFAIANVDPEYAELAMWMQRGWGEFWIDEMVELYRKYANESVRNNGDIRMYIQEIAEELKKKVPEENAPVLYQKRVPVTPLRAFDRGAITGKVVVVYGTQNPDPEGTEYDRETAELIANNLKTFYSQWNGSVEIVVKADVNVTDDELGENLVLVGGPAANSIVAEMQEHFPLRFVKEGDYWVIEHNTNWSVDSFIITENESDPVLKGRLDLSDDLTAALLLAVRNPDDPENYIVWIAGADRYGTRLFRNPTYYLSSYEVFTGKEIEMGFYVQPLASS